MATAGFKGTVSVDTSEVTGCRDIDFGKSKADLETTSFDDENVQRITGLGDANASLECVWSPTDAGQNVLRGALDSGDAVTLEYLIDGTNGYTGDFIVTEEDLSQGVGDIVVSNFTLMLAEGSVSNA